MAIETQKIIRDDFDGSIIDNDKGGTCSFALFGKTYELELSEANQNKLVEMFAPFISVARETPTAAGGTSSQHQTRADVGYEMKEARQWLIKHGHDVPKRGVVPYAMLDIFEKETGASRA